MLLKSITDPADLKKLSVAELQQVSEEARTVLLEKSAIMEDITDRIWALSK